MSTTDIRDSFFQECEDLLEALQEGFRQMDSAEHDVETIHAVFRAVHSIKGGAGAFALDELVTFAHSFETVLDRVRADDLRVTPEVMHLFHRAGDHLSDLVAAARDGRPANQELGAQLLAELDSHAGPPEADSAPVLFEPMTLDLPVLQENDPPAAGTARVYRIRFAPLPELYTTGNEPALLFRALAKLGALTVQADTTAVPAFDDLDWQASNLSWNLTLTTEAAVQEITAIFEFVEDLCILEIDEDTERIQQAAPAGMAEQQPCPPHHPAPPMQEEPSHPAPPTSPEAARTPAATIRVNLDRVDRLINLVGELVIKEAMLSQSIAQIGLPSESEVSAGLDGLKQLAGDIQEGVMAIRAQPVKSMFQRMFRIVREAADATGKQVELVVQGDQTEVDKTVIERLVDPLTHMIRNAVDHGLEDPQTRRASGKPERGTVTLSAAHRSGRVMIDIADDGAGINRERVRSIARDKGLITADAELNPSEIDNLLFLPGFSSKENVSALSGRGVGLDVARSEIQSLGGRVLITSSPGAGTTFSISLPLTLAVLEGMVVEVAGQTMIVPITAIQETLKPAGAGIHPLGRNGRVLSNRGDLVPIIDLGEAFGFRPRPEEIDSHVLLLVETDSDRRCALVVDHIHDQRQVVIKSLESNFGHVSGVAAATILGDGRIALIIDPDEIVAGSSDEPVAYDLPLAAAG